MEWIAPVKDLWWLVGILLAMMGALWRLAIQTNKNKERLEKVAKHDETIKTLSREITGIKSDISEIKSDMPAILGALQAVMNALADDGCNIGAARDKLNDHLAKR